MDLRIPNSHDLNRLAAAARAARNDPTSDLPSDEHEPPADKLILDADLLKKVQAALEGKGKMPSEVLPDKSGEPTSQLRVRLQDDLLPDKNIELPLTEVGTDLTGTRFKMQEDPRAFNPPAADKEGNFIFKLDDPRQAAVNAYASAYKALDVAQKYLGRTIDWGFRREADPKHLWIHPHAGEGFNAFYSSKNGTINFLYAEDPHAGTMVDTAGSQEVVSHETGHAILDGLRPDYIDAIDTATAGFHEAFGDCVAMLSTLSDPDALDALFIQTRGNLGKSNLVSRMAEGLGSAIRGPKKGYLRDANNDQTYRDAHFLPFMQFPEGPALEPHAYSQVWTAANYDVLRLLVAAKSDGGHTPFIDAVKDARDTLGGLIFRSIEFAPPGKINYKEAARAMMKADLIDNDGDHLKLLMTVFTGRNILTEDDVNGFMEEIGATKRMADSVHFPESKDGKPASFDKDAAQKFLEAHAADLDLSADEAKELKFSRLITNDRGENIVIYSQEKKYELTEPEWGSELQGSSFTIKGGLLLAFDKNGELIARTHDPITADNVADSKLFLRKMTDFQNNPPIIIKKGGGSDDDDSVSRDKHLDYLLASSRKPFEVVNGEIHRSGIVY